ncbi:YdcH family protein [Lujinxingia litoralis]|nr:YdcH family protein [Lujinxingia litoralis]
MQQRRSAPPPTSMTIDELRAQHQALEERLQELEALRSLSPEEQFETRVIKKRKLSIKDALRVMGAGEA